MSNNISITYNIGTTNGWSVSGNSVNNGVLGTKNDAGFDIISNDLPRISVDNDGEIGIGTTPQSGLTLTVSGLLSSDMLLNPQLVEKNIITPPNSNSLLIGPDVSIGIGYTITLGVNSYLTII
jgi:hypothetical protein